MTVCTHSISYPSFLSFTTITDRLTHLFTVTVCSHSVFHTPFLLSTIPGCLRIYSFLCPVIVCTHPISHPHFCLTPYLIDSPIYSQWPFVPVRFFIPHFVQRYTRSPHPFTQWLFAHIRFLIPYFCSGSYQVNSLILSFDNSSKLLWHVVRIYAYQTSLRIIYRSTSNGDRNPS